MEKTNRSFKFREDVAVFGADEAILAREIEEHNKKTVAHASDVKAYEGDLASYNAALADYSGRLASHNAEAEAHNSEVAAYTAQCVGAPLPPGPFARCNSWQQSLNSRQGPLNSRKARPMPSATVGARIGPERALCLAREPAPRDRR